MSERPEAAPRRHGAAQRPRALRPDVLGGRGAHARRRHPRRERAAPAHPRRRPRAVHARRRAHVRDARRAAGDPAPPARGAALVRARQRRRGGRRVRGAGLARAPARRLPRRARLDGDRHRPVARHAAQPRPRALPRRRAQDGRRLRARRRRGGHGQGARALRDASRRAAPARRGRRRGHRSARAARLRRPVGALGSLAAIGFAFELFAWRERHPGSLGARALAGPGTALQRALATAEPGEAELEVAERALAALLAAEAPGAAA